MVDYDLTQVLRRTYCCKGVRTPARVTASGTIIVDGVNRESGAQRRTLDSLSRLVKQRMYCAFEEVGVEKKQLLSRDLSPHTIAGYLGELQKLRAKSLRRCCRLCRCPRKLSNCGVLVLRARF